VPIYHNFIETIIDELLPDYMVSINPSRWMVGGKGLGDFRDRMMVDSRIKTIVHFPGEREVFPTVSIKGGVNYFLWDKNYNGKCSFNDVERFLDEFDIVIQDNQALPILKKVLGKTEKWLGQKCASRKPFGLESNFSNWQVSGTPCYSIGHKVNFVDPIVFTDKNDIIGKWKVAISKADGAAKSEDKNGAKRVISDAFIIEPNAICTETYLIVNTFNSKKEAENFITYMRTKFSRFMLGLRCLTQNVSKENFAWVPDMEDYSEPWTDEELYKKFNLTRQEREYIESKIKELK
jgi:site-specific DNA-methyltransferase (adenine-specific)